MMRSDAGGLRRPPGPHTLSLPYNKAHTCSGTQSIWSHFYLQLIRLVTGNTIPKTLASQMSTN